MEPTSILASLATKGGEAGIDTAKEGIRGFFQTVFGPYAEAWGENLALGPKERLHNNLIEIVTRAAKKAKDAGIDPKQVPLKVIILSSKQLRLKISPICRIYGRA